MKVHLMDRTWYKLVDCLEEVTNFWNYGKNFTTVPTDNVYIPTRQTIMNKPDLLEGDRDDVSYKFNMNRLSPAHTLNTLKGFKMNPPPGNKLVPTP